jgi:hypothetical protein
MQRSPFADGGPQILADRTRQPPHARRGKARATGRRQALKRRERVGEREAEDRSLAERA